jgi:hypothetical protein
MFTKLKFHQITMLFFSALLAVGLLAGAFPNSALAADADCQKTITVGAGQSIYRISREEGVSVNRIANANNLEAPYKLIAGQKLCIPKTPEPSSNFKWTPTYDGTQVTVDGTNFKKQYAFFVKARENDTSKFIKLGKAVSGKDGTMDFKKKVPASLMDLPKITVCLKDGHTNYLTCKLVYKS